MRKLILLLIGCVAIAGWVVAAEETTDSVESVLKELAEHQAAPVVPAAEVPVAEKPAVVEVPPVAAPAVVAPVADANDTVDVADARVDSPEVAIEEPAITLEEAQELYVGGKFAAAQRGFEEIIKKDKHNVLAALYLRKILERDHRKVEPAAMNEVDAAWSSAMVFRSYSVSEEGAGDMGLTDAEGATDAAAIFPEVEFPKGSSAVYQPKLSKLFVRNTRENLLVLEEILDAMKAAGMGDETEQVEIETKFVEISEGALEELGFNWGLMDEVKLHDGDRSISLPSQGVFFDAMRTGSEVFKQPREIGSPYEKEAGYASAGTADWRANRFNDMYDEEAGELILAGQLGTVDFAVLIRALDQSSGVDVLSAPRVVTRNGETAIIRVGQKHFYPEVYEVGSTDNTMLYVEYEDFGEKLLGVEFEVTPQLDGNLIDMELNPKITELLGWQSFQIAPADSVYTYYQYRVGNQFNHDPIIARLPIYKKREIQTSATIKDGNTLAMGGLIGETKEAFEDRIPVMGSIPLIGRLFRSEGERMVKRNLMIFVSAKKVDASGRKTTTRSFEE